MLILLRADNDGEGGTLALMALAKRAVGGTSVTIILLGIISAALFYGDAMITPAISVLSAIEGLKIVTPALEALRRADHRRDPGRPLRGAIARHGEGRGVLRPDHAGLVRRAGLGGICPYRAESRRACRVQSAHGVMLPCRAHGWIGLLTLGAVFLAVTGCEALYADLGHFGRGPIQTAWLFVALPALTLNYLGQGRARAGKPRGAREPVLPALSGMGPASRWSRSPTAATVIASQAVITGAYSLTQQAIQLGLLPRLEIRHTSAALVGQIYMPRVNGSCSSACCSSSLMFRLVERARLRLRHRRDRHHGGDRAPGVRGDLEVLEVAAWRRQR